MPVHGGSISPSGNVTVECGASQTINITPDPCYRILDVKVDGVSVGAVNSYTFNNVTANHTIEATFERIKYTITSIAGSGGSISPSGNVTVECGASQTINITPDPCYRILDVKVDGVSVGAVNSYTFNNVTANHTIEATFERIKYTITSIAGSGGNISPSGNVIVECGANQTFTVTPNQFYRILDVKIDGVSAGAVNSYTINNITGNHTIEATFEKIKYTITSTAGPGGSISPSGNVIVECGASQIFNITPDPCFRILDVKVDGVSQGAINSYTFNDVKSDHKVEVAFEKEKYLIEVIGSCGITPSENLFAECGTSQTFSINLNTCYHIKDLKIDGVSVGVVSSYTFNNITAAHSIETICEKDKYIIEATSGNGGIISPSGNVTVECGANQTFTITPDSCYRILDVKVDGVSKGTVESYTFSNIDANHKIEAVFAKKTHTVTFINGSNGNLTGKTIQSITCGECAEEITAIADNCYEFTGWSGDYTGKENPLKLCNVTGDMNITANFAKKIYTVAFASGSNGSLSGKTVQNVACGECAEEITAIADDCYEFTGWIGDYTGKENPLKLCNVTGNMNITANFAKKRYTVTFVSGSNGSLSGKTVQSVACGECAETVIPAPDDCYEFTGWSGDYTGKENPLKLCNVTGNMNVTANFAVKEFEVKFIGVGNGCLEGETVQKVKCGENTMPIKAVPGENYYFADWSGDYPEKDVYPNPMTYGPVTKSLVIAANFETENLPVLSLYPEMICMPDETEKFDVTVIMQNVTEIASYQFNILYDPLTVMIEDEKDVKLNNLLNSDNVNGKPVIAINNLTGKLTVGADVTNEDKLPEGDFSLATVTFKVLRQHKGLLDLNQVRLINRCGYDLITEKTGDAELGIKTPPVVTTYEAENIDSTSVSLSGNVVSESCEAIAVKGICWGTDEYPSVECSMWNTVCGVSTDGARSRKD